MKLRVVRSLLLVLLLWSLAPASRVHAELAPDYQQWAVLNLDLVDPVAKGTRFTLNAESRLLNTPRRAASSTDTGKEEQNPNTLIMLRPIFGYQFVSWFTGWMGYAFQPIIYRSAAREDIGEHRVFEQLSGDFAWTALQLSYRTRLEHRYRTSGDNETTKQGEGDWAHRFRQLLRLAYTPVPQAPLQLIVYDELFVHLTTTPYPSRTGLDQNRVFAGLGFQTSSFLRLEAGYLNQTVRRFTDRHQANHVLWISANFRFAFDRTKPAQDPTGNEGR